MTHQNEAAEARNDLDRQARSHSSAESPATVKVPGDRAEIKGAPAFALAMRWNVGRVLLAMWRLAPWSPKDGDGVFVWPKPAYLMGELGLSRSAVYRALQVLADAGQIKRHAQDTRHGTRKGWLLACSEGEFRRDPLFAHAAERDTDVPTAGTEKSQGVGFRSSIGPDSEPPPTSARARATAAAPTPQEEVEDSGGDTTPPPQARPKPAPTPTPDTPPAAVDARVLDLWQASEREREASKLGGGLERPATPVRLAAVQALLEQVVRDEGVTVDAAAARIRKFLPAAARFARKKRDDGNALYANLRVAQPFSLKAYEQVMAHADLEPDRPATRAEAMAAWKASEFQWDDGRQPLVYDTDDKPVPLDDATVAAMDATAAAFFASIQPESP